MDVDPFLHCAGVHRGEDPGGGGGQGAGVEGGQAGGRGRVGLHGAGRYIYTISTQYLHNVNNINNIYTISTSYLHNIFTAEAAAGESEAQAGHHARP